MYSIGIFSKMNQVTTKTLRHYDEIGLLVPCHIDPETGYRYYTGAELSRMHRIISLKQMGLSLVEIMSILNEFCSEDEAVEILIRKKREIQDSVAVGVGRLTLIEDYLNRNEKKEMSQYTAKIKRVPECTVASLRRVIADYTELNYLMPCVLGAEMKRLGCVCAEPEYCFNMYHHDEYRETDIDVEMCQAVVEAKGDSELICFKIMPAVEICISVLHRGPYSGEKASLGQAYSFAFEWMEKNGYELVDRPRESYIDGIWNKDSEEDWLTEIQCPVRKRGAS